MFMQRLITSLILIPLVLVLIFYAPRWCITGIILLLLWAAGREAAQLVPLEARNSKLLFILSLFASYLVCGLLFNLWLIIGLVLWLFIIAAILGFPNSQRYWGNRPVVAGVSCFILPLFAQSVLHLYDLPKGKALFVYILFLVWSADIGAYLAGKRWGMHKLIPQVSPGKSWEGALGGGLLVMVIAGIGALYFSPFTKSSWFILAALITIISIFGDLFVSILKRRCNLKDTGALIPGHGGILDRLDSVIAALPFFYFFIGYVSLAA
jgi:phosphatidate cytidylyltransferase